MYIYEYVVGEGEAVRSARTKHDKNVTSYYVVDVRISFTYAQTAQTYNSISQSIQGFVLARSPRNDAGWACVGYFVPAES